MSSSKAGNEMSSSKAGNEMSSSKAGNEMSSSKAGNEMSSSNAGNDGSDNDNNKGESSSSRFTSEQKTHLKVFFEQYPNPTQTQQDEIAKSLGLQQEQVAEWLHEKRTTQAQVIESHTMDLNKEISQPPPESPALDISRDHAHHHEVPNSLSRSLIPSGVSDEAEFLREKSRMLQLAKAATVELLKISKIVEPLWSLHGGRFVMDHKTYHTMFPRDSNPNVFKTPYTREESSTDIMEVNMTAMKMVEALLNPKEMTELFPTMIRRAKIIKEYEHGAVETRHGALLLMYIKIHHLSHLVLPRKYYFLRYCVKVNDSGIWVISDVSLNVMGANLSRYLPSWKLPSGCIIHQMQNTRNSVWVHWIEHVEVNGDRPQIGSPYGDLVANNIPYSAEKWIRILERTAEKLRYSAEVPIEGMRSLLHISHRMSQRFCEILKVSTCINGNLRCSVHNNSGPELPTGIIATIVNSVSLPLNFNTVFNFLTDATKRNQWDPLCVGSYPFEVASIGTGPCIGNRLSIIRRNVHDKNKGYILQESSIDNFTAHIVYTRIDKNMQSSERDSQLRILPSGFFLSGDTRSVPSLLKKTTATANPQLQGTLLTICFQMLVSSTPSTNELNMTDLEVALTIYRMMFHNLTVALK